MSEFPYETFRGETVYAVKQSARDQIAELMLKEGFSCNIPTVHGVYLVVFWTRCGNKAVIDNQEDPDVPCGSYFRNVTAGYTYGGKDMNFVFASHYNPNPTFGLNDTGVKIMKDVWKTEDIWWKLVEEF